VLAIGGTTLDGGVLRAAEVYDPATATWTTTKGPSTPRETSCWHHNFKTVTAMSPLQFQKQLRLQEARRLLLGGGVDAATAGYRVGYDEPSQFSREYKKLFGAPPRRDVVQLEERVASGARRTPITLARSG
jgi:methylphosphotriester-DNA--protein-cysteine methyltransferase